VNVYVCYPCDCLALVCRDMEGISARENMLATKKDAGKENLILGEVQSLFHLSKPVLRPWL
jgi:hypothetical protein